MLTSEESSQRSSKKWLRSWGYGQTTKKFNTCIACLSVIVTISEFLFSCIPALHLTIFSEPQAVSVWSITSPTFPKNSTIFRSNSAMFDVKVLVTCQVVRACKTAWLINEGPSSLSGEAESQSCTIQTLRFCWAEHQLHYASSCMIFLSARFYKQRLTK